MTDEIKELFNPPSNIESQEIDKTFLDVLKTVSPGTPLRTALEDLLRARMGAIIAIDGPGLFDIVERGFRINAKFSPQRLVELAKMDGAIILSEDGKKILYANALLYPNLNIPTKETGTRHKAAERTARQTKAIVLAVSERKNKITLYYSGIKHVLDRSAEILRRASETLQILEKQKELYDDAIINFNFLEINSLATPNDLSLIFQRIEVIQRIAGIIRRYLVELGKDGFIVKMRLKELTSSIEKETDLILYDYFGEKASEISLTLSKMNFDFILEHQNISKVLFGDCEDKLLSSKGKRFLTKAGFSPKLIDLIIDRFKTLEFVFNASSDDLLNFFQKENEMRHFDKKVNALREKIITGRKI